MTREVFYDAPSVAILPMGFCYPVPGKSGDFPPRPECAPARREPLLAEMPRIQLTLVVGQYALAYLLPGPSGSLTEAVQNWRSFGAGLLPLPHPSPRNNRWLKRNPWFASEVLPDLRSRVAQAQAPARSKKKGR